MRRFAYPALTVVGVLVVWQLVVVAFKVPIYLLPAPTDIGEAIADNGSLLLTNGIDTLKATLIGFAISVVLASVVASAIVASRKFEQAVYPLLASSQMVPKIAVAPLFLVWFGFGSLPKILIVVMESFFPIVLSMVVGLVSVDREMVQLLRSMGASTLQEFRKVRFPNALPNVFGGLKIGIILAVIGAIVGEFVGSNSGLGYVLLNGTGTINTTLVFAAIFALMVMGLVLIYAVRLAERLAIPWGAAEDMRGGQTGVA